MGVLHAIINRVISMVFISAVPRSITMIIMMCRMKIYFVMD